MQKLDRMRIASALPKQLSEIGQLTVDQAKEIKYHLMESEQKVWIHSTVNKVKYLLLLALWANEAAIKFSWLDEDGRMQRRPWAALCLRNKKNCLNLKEGSIFEGVPKSEHGVVCHFRSLLVFWFLTWTLFLLEKKNG